MVQTVPLIGCWLSPASCLGELTRSGPRPGSAGAASLRGPAGSRGLPAPRAPLSAGASEQRSSGPAAPAAPALQAVSGLSCCPRAFRAPPGTLPPHHQTPSPSGFCCSPESSPMKPYEPGCPQVLRSSHLPQNTQRSSPASL